MDFSSPTPNAPTQANTAKKKPNLTVFVLAVAVVLIAAVAVLFFLGSGKEGGIIPSGQTQSREDLLKSFGSSERTQSSEELAQLLRDFGESPQMTSEERAKLLETLQE